MGAIHAAFASGAYENWAATCDALVSQALREVAREMLAG